jgi:hypothetical protein
MAQSLYPITGENPEFMALAAEALQSMFRAAAKRALKRK